ncbi:MAG: tail fiber domain-containing protein [Patescibacteria group bacterium]|nr:tail fiber domain-containing protein [Patescibacteria group bacterium]
MQPVLDKLAKVRPVDFKWLNQSDGVSHVGFIAQELEDVFPEMVQTNPDGYKSVAYTNFIPILTKAIQQQQDEIQAIKLQLQGVGDNVYRDDLAVVDVPFSGNLTVKGHVFLSADSVGEAKILAGSTSVRVTFSALYEYQPIVTITMVGDPLPVFASVSGVDSTGFTIKINQAQGCDLNFAWHVFASPEAQLTVSDGTTQDIELVVPAPPATPPADVGSGDQGSPEVLGQNVTKQPKDAVNPENVVDKDASFENLPDTAGESMPPKEEVKTPDSQTPPAEEQQAPTVNDQTRQILPDPEAVTKEEVKTPDSQTPPAEEQQAPTVNDQTRQILPDPEAVTKGQ